MCFIFFLATQSPAREERKEDKRGVNVQAVFPLSSIIVVSHTPGSAESCLSQPRGSACGAIAMDVQH